jgi:hypothetical protein
MSLIQRKGVKRAASKQIQETAHILENIQGRDKSVKRKQGKQFEGTYNLKRAECKKGGKLQFRKKERNEQMRGTHFLKSTDGQTS